MVFQCIIKNNGNPLFFYIFRLLVFLCWNFRIFRFTQFCILLFLIIIYCNCYFVICALISDCVTQFAHFNATVKSSLHKGHKEDGSCYPACNRSSMSYASEKANKFKTKSSDNYYYSSSGFN